MVSFLGILQRRFILSFSIRSCWQLLSPMRLPLLLRVFVIPFCPVPHPLLRKNLHFPRLCLLRLRLREMRPAVRLAGGSSAENSD